MITLLVIINAVSVGFLENALRKIVSIFDSYQWEVSEVNQRYTRETFSGLETYQFVGKYCVVYCRGRLILDYWMKFN